MYRFHILVRTQAGGLEALLCISRDLIGRVLEKRFNATDQLLIIRIPIDCPTNNLLDAINAFPDHISGKITDSDSHG